MTLEQITTRRLRLRRPRSEDAGAVFERYASDPEVTTYLSWPTHLTLEDTRAFLDFSDEHWGQWNTGPWLIEALGTGRLLGSTGIGMSTAVRGETGYVLAKDCWGRGYAAEALAVMVGHAREMGLWRLDAIVHHVHSVSARILERGGFECEGLLRSHTLFPNLDPLVPQDVYQYGLVLRA